LRKVSLSLQQRNEFPFPMKNTLYNTRGKCGRVLSVQLCFVGILTCPDDGWKSSINEFEAGQGIFDVLVAARYRVPPTTGKTRLEAFSSAFERNQVVSLDASARERLPSLAQGFHSARGSTFCRVAAILRMADRNDDGTISALALERAMQKVQNESAAFTKSEFEASTEMISSGQDEESDLFGAVGGAVAAKRALEDALAVSSEKRSMLARFGMSPPTGVLLYGPPGCGKTLLAKAVAKLLKRPSGSNADGSLGGSFLSISSSDIVSSEIGTSEKTLLSAFEFADKNPPAVIFFDEFQALFTERSRGGSGKLASTLLQCMDDIRRWSEFGAPPDAVSEQTGGEQPSRGPRVVVLGATNTPWMVDPAFLRAGRFDRVVHVDLPDEAERKSILVVHLRNMRVEKRETNSMLADLAARIAGRTNGFSGADLSALCRAAAIRALLDENDNQVVTEAHFVGALEEDATRSSDESLLKRLREWKP
jgi:SpoVK/Ycf46/Vps4 family AAA+-type ATPase